MPPPALRYKPYNIVAVTGGRDYKKRKKLFRILDEIHEEEEINLLVIGCCPTGADKFAQEWAEDRRISYAKFFAKWKKHGKQAGPMRNNDMINRASPRLLVAFPGGTGTENCKMYARARKAQGYKIKIKEIK